MLEKGANYIGTVTGITENYDRFSGNAGMTYCHKIILLVGKDEVIAQVCQPSEKFTEFKVNETINFTVTANGKSIPTIRKITIQEAANPAIASTVAAVALMASVNLYQHQLMDEKTPDRVIATADLFSNWLKHKNNGK